MDPLVFSRRVKLGASPEALWRVLSDTDRLNKALGLPKVSYEPPPSGGVVRRAYAVFHGVFPMAWDEHPFDWAEGDHYWVERVFRGGPFARFKGGLRLGACPEGCDAEVFAEVTPSGLLGRVAAAAMAGKGVEDMAALIEKAAACACAGGPDPLRPEAPRDTVDAGRLDALLARAAGKADRAALERLRRHIETSDDHEAATLRPFELADRWGLDRMAVLTACLHACRAGALDLRWELLCPHCRVAKSASGSLCDVKAQAHCDFCDWTFDAQLDVNMEVRFAPNPSVRPVTAGTFCIGGPAASRHRPAQLRLAPGETRTVTLPLRPRRYVVRGLLGEAETRLVPDAAAPGSAARVAFTGGEAAGGEARLRPGPAALTLVNEGSEECWAVVEETDWPDTSATAAFVTSLQDFRDLFSAEVLAPGTEVSVRSLALVFTDLKGSTALYERVGDARAYSVVREHFSVLFEVVRRRRGAVVKTIGDAVMAAFSDPADAAAAAVEMHERLIERNRTLSEPVVLKVGVHEGPAIAINADGTLDYFGTTVNLAARVQSESVGGDVVATAGILESPRAAAALCGAGTAREDFETTVKGLSAPVRLCRVWPKASLDAGLKPG